MLLPDLHTDFTGGQSVGGNATIFMEHFCKINENQKGTDLESVEYLAIYFRINIFL